MALPKFRDPADPIWEARINGIEEGTQLSNLPSTALGQGSVTEFQLGTQAVGGQKARLANFPVAKAGEGEFGSPAFLGTLRTSWVAYTSKGEAKEEIKKIKHFLETENVVLLAVVDVKATKKVSGASVKQTGIGNASPAGWEELVVENGTEVMVKLNFTPSAKDEIYFFFGA